MVDRAAATIHFTEANTECAKSAAVEVDRGVIQCSGGDADGADISHSARIHIHGRVSKANDSTERYDSCCEVAGEISDGTRTRQAKAELATSGGEVAAEVDGASAVTEAGAGGFDVDERAVDRAADGGDVVACTEGVSVRTVKTEHGIVAIRIEADRARAERASGAASANVEATGRYRGSGAAADSGGGVAISAAEDEGCAGDVCDAGSRIRFERSTGDVAGDRSYRGRGGASSAMGGDACAASGNHDIAGPKSALLQAQRTEVTGDARVQIADASKAGDVIGKSVVGARIYLSAGADFNGCGPEACRSDSPSGSPVQNTVSAADWSEQLESAGEAGIGSSDCDVHSSGSSGCVWVNLHGACPADVVR